MEPCLVANGDEFEFIVNFVNRKFKWIWLNVDLKAKLLFLSFTASATTSLRADALAFLANIPLPFEIPADRIDGKYLSF